MQRFDAVNREVQGKCTVFPDFLSDTVFGFLES